MAQHIPTTNAKLVELYTREGEIEKLVQGVLISRRTKEFIHDNRIRMESAMKERNALQDEFFEIETTPEGGTLVKHETKKIPIPLPEQKPLSWFERNIKRKKLPAQVQEFKEEKIPVLKEGKTMEEFNKRYDEWARLQKTIQI